MPFKEVFEEIFKPVIIIVEFFVIFFKAIPKLLSLIIKTLQYFIFEFVPLLFQVITDIPVFLQTLLHYLTHPEKLFDLFVQFIIFIVVILISIVYHIPLQNKFSLGDYILYGLLLIPYNAYFIFRLGIWFVLKLIVEYGLFQSIDRITNGALQSFYYRNFLACENAPDIWYRNPSYHFQNKNEKILFAFLSCPQGYKPNGIFCSKNKSYERDYCDEAILYNNFVGNTALKQRNNNLNQSRSSFLKKNSSEKQDEVDDYIQDIRIHSKSCKNAFEYKDSLLRAICNSNELSKSNLQQCKQIFCTENKSNFCHKFDDIKKRSLSFEKNSKNISISIVYSILIIISIVFIARKNFSR